MGNNMIKKELGTLTKLDLREVWDSEATDFTPWLAEEDNLKLLGDTIGLDLELEAQEKNVGPFRADILCKDTASDNWVLVENQLEKTDHTHLGQLMTYASGLKAVTIVWLAKRFTDEHRSALDWLNSITDDTINFFGLEVELWQIGESSVAPKFNMISKPNDWTSSVSGAAGKLVSGEISEIKQLQQEFWAGFKEHLIEHDSFIKTQKPLPQHWTNLAIGRSHFWMAALVNTRDKKVSCVLSMSGPDGKTHFNMLFQDKEKIEQEMGEPLIWRGLPSKKESNITISYDNIDPTKKDNWPELHQWLKEKLEKIHSVFSNRIKYLNADEYIENNNSNSEDEEE